MDAQKATTGTSRRASGPVPPINLLAFVRAGCHARCSCGAGQRSGLHAAAHHCNVSRALDLLCLGYMLTAGIRDAGDLAVGICGPALQHLQRLDSSVCGLVS
jgi:hypothetical protein